MLHLQLRRLPTILTRRHAGHATSLRAYASRTSPRKARRSLLRPIAGVAGLASVGVAVFNKPNEADGPSAQPAETPKSSSSPSLAKMPFGTLLRSFGVYTSLSLPFVVDYSQSLLDFLTKVPVVAPITLYCVRHTFFAQFVGGETAEQVVPLMRTLREQRKGSILTYNVEVDESKEGAEAENAATWKRNVDEIKRSIEVMGSFRDEVRSSAEGIVAIKLTALLPSAASLTAFSNYLVAHRQSPSASTIPYPGTPESSDVAILTSQQAIKDGIAERDVEAVRTMYQNVRAICALAAERDVRILIDAEHTWYQPALDAITMAVSQEFNRSKAWRSTPRPTVYGTYQAYLRRNPEHLQAQLRHAKSNSYALGVKLVRGAYHGQEVAHAAPQPAPVWTKKEDTDACYDSSARVVLRDIARGKAGTGVLFGTHNRASVEGILEGMVEEGLAVREGRRVKVQDGVEGRVAIAQLYGMCDNLTDELAERLISKSAMATKCIPYGALEEVMPYLARRAVENKSVLGAKGGGAAEERARTGSELWRRMKSWVML